MLHESIEAKVDIYVNIQRGQLSTDRLTLHLHSPSKWELQPYFQYI